ncbi:hypothetical protein Tgr7_0387 [Thioalkalivibrio sulfidiphilus HL-EbGr7]|uniref:Zinc-ribbon 15 domain-containing protein n=1 Tax=Thioalkalivibrio sulfidiphilus (strain HL-EbGR7) TaxID=396588 RepID=B8GUX4_THISH|nr:YqaE/Pmp3 family membrane protein [Thioalkalivibrio sulfidiphilus]ACL71485.1 hypothetical protein Tgr7_0387 [Thioalkalivibrio sulfidiphilus HL-EbGr7]
MGIGGISLWQLLMIFVYVGVVVVLFRSIRLDSKKALICSRCGTANKARTHTRGSIFIEILLWLMFIIPGLIYSIWRLTTRGKVCGVCGSADLVPLTSPAGQELSARYGQHQDSAGSDPDAKVFAKGAAERAKLAEATARYRETQAAGKKGHPASSPADTGYSITGADESPAPTRSGTRPTGSSTPSDGRRE